MKKVVCCICLFIALGCPLLAGNVTFAWDPNPPHEQVETYVLYERVGENYFAITSTLGTNLVVKDVAAGYHCYALKARNAWGESLFSNEVCVEVENGGLDSGKDLVAPSSHVLPLAEKSYERFEVSWFGQDQPGGTGVASYDIFVSVNGGPFQAWLHDSTATNALFQGDLDTVYTFYSVATDKAGNRENGPDVGDASTWVSLINHPPELKPFPSMTLNVGEVLVLTNETMDVDVPFQSLRYSLCSDALPRAYIDPETGVFVWTPRLEDAGKTKQICVNVFDDGSPNLANTLQIEVTVNHFLDIEFEDFAVSNGQTGRVPLSIFTSVPVRDLFFTLELPPEMQVDASFVPSPGRSCYHYFLPSSPGIWFFMIRACDQTPFYDSELLGELTFQANTTQSKFVSFRPQGFSAMRMDGVQLNHVASQKGRGAILRDTPLLEMVVTEANKPGLVVYGRPGQDYLLERSTLDQGSLSWQPWLEISMTNIVRDLGSVGLEENGVFRLRESGALLKLK